MCFRTEHRGSHATDARYAEVFSAEQVDGGIEHLHWSVRTALTHFTSFSVETVSVPQTRALMDEYVCAHPDQFWYHELECADYTASRRRAAAS